jgi:predicted GNAT family N-acyltransferase
MTIEVGVVPFSSHAAVLYAIRDEVFVSEQHVPIELEHDEDDLTCTHVLALLDGVPAGTGRILADGKIGRMAVLRQFRGQGVGEVLLAALLNVARARGLAEAWCHAQQSAFGFYEKAGFAGEGPLFQEAGITHQLMRLPL